MINPFQTTEETKVMRAHLAAQMMAGLLSNGSYMETMSKAANSEPKLLMVGSAVLAVQAADTLIAQLSKETP